ncbi:MAG: TetR/AcrR family transcriptional regulator [Lentihominibacter sp.]
MNERTRKAIFESFNQLLSKTDLDRITVRMIAENAGVSKATFYRYFKDKYDVMAYNYKVFVDNRVNPSASGSYEELLYLLYRDSENSMDYLQNAFKYVGVNSFTDYVYKYSFDIVERITLANRPSGLTQSEIMQLDVFSHGVSKMFTNWILGKYRLNAGSAARALYEMMPESLKHYWWV